MREIIIIGLPLWLIALAIFIGNVTFVTETVEKPFSLETERVLKQICEEGYSPWYEYIGSGYCEFTP